MKEYWCNKQLSEHPSAETWVYTHQSEWCECIYVLASSLRCWRNYDANSAAKCARTPARGRETRKGRSPLHLHFACYQTSISNNFALCLIHAKLVWSPHLLRYVRPVKLKATKRRQSRRPSQISKWKLRMNKIEEGKFESMAVQCARIWNHPSLKIFKCIISACLKIKKCC